MNSNPTIEEIINGSFEDLHEDAEVQGQDPLEIELADIKADYADFGPEGFYRVPFKSFCDEFPEFSRRVLIDYLQNYAETELTPETIKDWKKGELIYDDDWYQLFKHADRLVAAGKDTEGWKYFTPKSGEKYMGNLKGIEEDYEEDPADEIPAVPASELFAEMGETVNEPNDGEFHLDEDTEPEKDYLVVPGDMEVAKDVELEQKKESLDEGKNCADCDESCSKDEEKELKEDLNVVQLTPNDQAVNLRSLIKACWDGVDQFSMFASQLNEFGSQGALATVNGLINDFYIAIGGLEEELGAVDPKSAAIDAPDQIEAVVQVAPQVAQQMAQAPVAQQVVPVLEKFTLDEGEPLNEDSSAPNVSLSKRCAQLAESCWNKGMTKSKAYSKVKELMKSEGYSTDDVKTINKIVDDVYDKLNKEYPEFENESLNEDVEEPLDEAKEIDSSKFDKVRDAFGIDNWKRTSDGNYIIFYNDNGIVVDYIPKAKFGAPYKDLFDYINAQSDSLEFEDKLTRKFGKDIPNPNYRDTEESLSEDLEEPSDDLDEGIFGPKITSCLLYKGAGGLHCDYITDKGSRNDLMLKLKQVQDAGNYTDIKTMTYDSAKQLFKKSGKNIKQYLGKQLDGIADKAKAAQAKQDARDNADHDAAAKEGELQRKYAAQQKADRDTARRAERQSVDKYTSSLVARDKARNPEYQSRGFHWAESLGEDLEESSDDLKKEIEDKEIQKANNEVEKYRKEKVKDSLNPDTEDVIEETSQIDESLGDDDTFDPHFYESLLKLED